MARADYTQYFSGLTTQSYNSGCSQFFIMTKANTNLNGYYTAFGKVTEGLDVVHQIENVEVKVADGQENTEGAEVSTPVNPPKVTSIRVETYGVDYGMPETLTPFDYTSWLYKQYGGTQNIFFVTGGVVSGLGKGITAASLGRLLKNRGYKVVNQKFDPYINVDPGTMSPFEHGEVFVTDDGAETDLDLGHYERFIDENLTKNSSVTMGRVYSNVIEKERKGEYLGKTVQVIPHITNEIKEKIYGFEGTDRDIVITEVGGTVGDIEGLSLIEAIRQVGLEKNPKDVCFIHVTLLPYIYGSNEIKSKPTQHSVKELQSLGIQPDILVCRTEQDIPDTIREKLALFCNVRKTSVIQNKTADCLYAVPINVERRRISKEVCNHLRLEKLYPRQFKMVRND